MVMLCISIRIANNLNEKTGGSRSEGITAIAGETKDTKDGDDAGGSNTVQTDKGNTRKRLQQTT